MWKVLPFVLLLCVPGLSGAEGAPVLRAWTVDRAPAVDGLAEDLWSQADPVVLRVEPITDDVGDYYYSSSGLFTRTIE